MSSTQKPKLPKNVVQDIKWRNKFVKNLGKCGLLMEMVGGGIEEAGDTNLGQWELVREGVKVKVVDGVS